MDNKKKLIEAISDLFKVVSTQAVIRSQSIAQKLNINSSDLEALEILFRLGHTTAGELAKNMGLTTGAITGVIDRLVKSNFVSRQYPKDDRRKVLIVLNIETINQKIMPLYQSLAEKYKLFLEKYSINELNFIIDFLNKTISISENDLLEM